MTKPGSGFDVVIVGSGPAGCAAALRLLQLGRSVAIVDRPARVNKLPHFEALAPQVRPLLEQLAAWRPFLQTSPIASAGIVSFWNSSAAEFTDHLFSPFQRGFHVDRAKFDSMLRDIAAKRGARDFHERRIADITRKTNGFRMTFDGRRTTIELHCRWLVDATGRAAAVARRLGTVRRRATDRVSLAASLPRSVGHPSSVAKLRLQAIGNDWWYALGLPNDKVYCVLQTERREIPPTAEQRKELWLERLHEAPQIARLVHMDNPPAALRVMPSDSSMLNQCVGRGWIAVGDAAIALDPLSGNGVIRAMTTAIKAADVVDSNGDSAGIASYEALIDEIAEEFIVMNERSYATSPNLTAHGVMAKG